MTQMTTATKPTPYRREASAGSRLSRTAAAVALSTLAVVTLASGAFAQLGDTVALLGFSVESNNVGGPPPPPPPPPGIVDLAIGEGDCSVATLDPTATTVSFATNGVLDIGGLVDGTSTYTSTTIADICFKNEGPTGVTVYGSLIAASSEEAGPCDPNGVEALAEASTDCGPDGELDDIAYVYLECTTVGSVATFNPSLPFMHPYPGHYIHEVQPGEMFDCSVRVEVNFHSTPSGWLEPALTDTLHFDLEFSGEQI